MTYTYSYKFSDNKKIKKIMLLLQKVMVNIKVLDMIKNKDINHVIIDSDFKVSVVQVKGVNIYKRY